MDVRRAVLGDTDLTTARVLEIGALHNPRVRKDEGDVSYLDLAAEDTLAAKYRDNPDAAPHLAGMVEVDYIWRPGQTLRETVAGRTFDLVIASHVIEHVANPIGWLAQASELLTEGDRLSLVIPDKRYCFDANRQLTTMADLVDAHLRRLDVPSARQVYDCEVNFMTVTAEELWAGVDVSHRRRTDVPDPDLHAFQLCSALAETGAYRDEHCSTFTPGSFLDLFRRIVALGLSDLSVHSIQPTEFGSYEFFVMLAKGAEVGQLADRLAHIDALRAQVDAHAARYAADTVTMTLSQRERVLIERKRAIMTRLRSWVGSRA